MNGDTYKQSGTGTPCLAMMNGASFTNSVLELEARKLSGSEGFLICYAGDSTNVNNYWRVNIGGWSNTKTAFQKVTDGNDSQQGGDVSMNIKTNRWYKIRLVMQETVGVTLYIDDVKKLTLPLSELEDGRVQAYGGYDSQTGEIVVKVVNALERATTATICLNADGIAHQGTITTLSANTLSEENSLDNPYRISPKTATYDRFANEFEYTFKPCSFTILRIKADNTTPSAMDIPTYEWDDTPALSNEAERRQTALRKSLQALIDKSKALAVERSSGVETFSVAITDAETLISQENATNKALETKLTNLQTAMDKYVTGLMTTDNEVTSKLKNPNFKTMQTTGWQGSSPSLEHNVGEFFNTTFDMYQTLTNLKPGQYLISVQAFYRNGAHNVAYPKHENGTEQLLARLYGGSDYTLIRSIYDQTFSQGSWNNYLDNREQAEKAFNSGSQTLANYLVATVGTNGRLRIGLKKSASVQYDWTCFNNFRIFFVPQAEDTGIKENVKIEKLKNANIYNLQGQRISVNSDSSAPSVLPKGIYIQDGKKIIKK